MSNTPQSEVLQLRTQLATLIEQARRNENIMRRHQEFDLTFIGASGFRDLIEHIFTALSASSELDVVTLAMLDPRYEIRRILHDLNIDLSEFPNLLFCQDADEFNSLPGLTSPTLGRFDGARDRSLFPSQVLQPASVALLPLRRHNTLIGMLCLGSLDESRFANSMATDFLEHMASIVAICLENVINIELLKHLGLMDPLTGVNNRRYVEQRLAEEIGRTRRHSGDLTCLYIDIDHFKQINDRFGHQIGDDVLREVATRIKAELRLSDTLGRFGGEEFVVLLPETPLTDGRLVAERIRASIGNAPFPLGPKKLQVCTSIGVAMLSKAISSLSIDQLGQQLISVADKALYEAKAAGRNRVHVIGQR